MILTSVDLVTHPRMGFQPSDDALNRFERLLQQTFLYLKDQCTDANLSDAWGEYLLRTRRKEGAYKIDIMTEVLTDREWLITPDISNQIFSVLKLIYFDAAQPIFDVIWAEAYKRDIVSSAVAPGIEIELPVDDVLNRSKKICDGIDCGTIAYLAKLLLDGDGKDFETIRYLMFDSGGNDEDTLADMRIRNIVNTETCWARNLCNLNVLSKLGLENKEWVKGTKQCEIASTNELVGSVSLDHEYVSNYGESVTAPPGCVGCDCRISSSFDQDLSILRELDSDTSNRSLGNVDGSGIVCIEPPDELRTLLGVKSPHITIVYLGKNGSSFWNLVELAVKKVCKAFAPFSLYLTGEMRTLGVPNRGDVDVALVCNSKELRRLKDALEDELKNMHVVEFSEWREWTPHITIGDAHTVSDDMIEDFGDPWVVDSLCIWVGNKSERFELEARYKEETASIIQPALQPVDENILIGVNEKAIRFGFRYSKSFVFDNLTSAIVPNGERYKYLGETPAMIKACLDGPSQSITDAINWLSKNKYNILVNDVPVVQEKKSAHEQTGGSVNKEVHVHFPETRVVPIEVRSEIKLPEGFVQQPVIKNFVNVPERAQPKIEVNVAQPQINVRVPKQEPTIIKNEIILPDQIAPNINVNVPRQERSIVNVTTPDINVYVPKSETKIEVNVPKQDVPKINLRLPKQDAPIIHVEPKIEVNVPEAVPPIINVVAEVVLPEEEVTSIVKDEKGQVKEMRKKRIYKRKI